MGSLSAIAQIAARHYRSRTDALRATAKAAAKLRRARSAIGPGKVVAVEGGRWRLRPYVPAWPSLAFDRWALRYLEACLPQDAPARSLSQAYVAITPRCPLACAHCSAADELGPDERLTLAQLETIVRELLAIGVSRIDLTGGEPLLRLDEVCALARAARGCEVWIDTSGWGLSEEVAQRLVSAGLDGVWLSLDSIDAAEHDAMRGREGAFVWAMRAAQGVRAHGLTLGLSMVPTKATLAEGRLEAYAERAAAMGAYAIRVVTPKASGRWAGRTDVLLDEADITRLARFTDEINGGPRSAKLPVVICDAVQARRIGCKSGGELSVYIDTWGRVHACPFCRSAAGSALHTPGAASLDEAIGRLRAAGCAQLSAGGAP